MASRALRRRSTYRALGRHSKQQSRPILKFLIVCLVGITMLTSGASAGTIFLYGNSLPSLKDFKKQFQFQNTVLKDWQGKVLYNLADLSATRGRRLVEPLQSPGHPASYFRANKQDWLVDTNTPGIPVLLQDATIATEDASFYDNLGFDPLSIARATYENLVKGHVVSGASTITQQLVRRYLLNDKATLTRKTEEVVLAAELTQKYPKTKILWYYLNSVPYGNLAIGAQAAAQEYFHKNVWDLDLAQSALLAGLPEAPSIYNPVNNLPAALNRMHYVLHLMCQHGYLRQPNDSQCRDVIGRTMAETKGWKFTPAQTIKLYPHFVQYAIDQLQSIPQLQGKIYNGLIVQTTLDERLQNAAQDIVKGQVSGLGSYNVTDGALVSMDLRPSCYGCVRAMVGSADYSNKAIAGQINMANTPRQPGSSFKPFNYVYAFQHGLAPGTTVLDGPVAIPDTGNLDDGGWYEPTNYDHTWHGTVSLRIALANSLNVPAVKVEQFSAAQANGDLRASVAQQAIKQGIKNLFIDNPHCCGWSLTLGGLERGVRLVQETAAYGAFATGGTTVPPVAIWKVWDRSSGKLLYSADRDDPDKPTRVMDPAYAYLMTSVLSDNASRCTPEVCEFGLDSPLNLGRTAAAKTGTTNSFTDNWTVGYTPDLVTGVWVGNANSTPMIGTTGVTGAAPIWHDYMLKALGILNLPPKDFTEPPDVYAGSACRQDTPYYAAGSTVYDLYASEIPLCSVGTYNTNLPVPQQNTPYQPPAVQPQAPAPAAAPAPTAVPIAPTTAPLAPPTAVPQQVPGVQSGTQGSTGAGSGPGTGATQLPGQQPGQ